MANRLSLKYWLRRWLVSDLIEDKRIRDLISDYRASALPMVSQERTSPSSPAGVDGRHGGDNGCYALRAEDLPWAFARKAVDASYLGQE